jgi:hypothetical protein
MAERVNTTDESVADAVAAAMAGKDWCSACCKSYEPGLLLDTNQEKSVCPYCGLGLLLVTTMISPADIQELYSLLGPNWVRMRAACDLFNKGFKLTRVRSMILAGKI